MERRCSYTEAKRLADCEAQGSLRLKFEKWISAPPYERDIYRWPQDETKHAWPGQYKDIAVQLAWDAWNEAHNEDRARFMTRYLVDIYKVEIPDNGKRRDDITEATEDWLEKHGRTRCYQFQMQGNQLKEIGERLAKQTLDDAS